MPVKFTFVYLHILKKKMSCHESKFFQKWLIIAWVMDSSRKKQRIAFDWLGRGYKIMSNGRNMKSIDSCTWKPDPKKF